MTNTTRITVRVPAGNYESAKDAAFFAENYRREAARMFPGADIDVEVLARQTGGGSTTVEIYDTEYGIWEEDETAAASLDHAAATNW